MWPGHRYNLTPPLVIAKKEEWDGTFTSQKSGVPSNQEELVQGRAN